jgi:glycosyltransferase involved in cell wall biosynthesis
VVSVVCPVFNQAGSIRATLGEVIARLEGRGLNFELIVVSDGSADESRNEALHWAGPRVRVLDYDRNLGKGYALRTGSLTARGEWIAWIDSDLDLDPAGIADFLARAQAEGLDVVIGSKRHRDSRVDYPRRRRLYSWGYQQVVRALFTLDVRDTQVGMKLFRRDVLREVLPVVVVKRFAFDIEVLAVARHFGHKRIVEGPVTLDYQFRGSGVNWRAIANALWDTAAVFYRLRVLRFYDKRRALARRLAAHSPVSLPRLAVITAPDTLDERERERIARIIESTPGGTRVIAAVGRHTEPERPLPAGVSVIEQHTHTMEERLVSAAGSSDAEVLAFLSPDARPSGGWATSALAFFGDPDVGAVVGPTVPRLGGSLLHDAAGILSESRLGTGGARIRHHVGKLREVDDFPASNLFVRVADLRAVLEGGASLDEAFCSALRARTGRAVICSPNVVVTTEPPPLFQPYAARLFRLGLQRGTLVSGGRRPRLRHLIPTALVVSLLLGPAAAVLGGPWLLAWLALIALYAGVLTGLGLLMLVMDRRPLMALAVPGGAAASHLSFGAGMLLGVPQGFITRLWGRGDRVAPRRDSA